MNREELERVLSFSDSEARLDPDRVRAALDADPGLAADFPEVRLLLGPSEPGSSGTVARLPWLRRRRFGRRIAVAALLAFALLLLWRRDGSASKGTGPALPARPLVATPGVPASTALVIERRLRLRSRVQVMGHLNVARTAPYVLAETR